jgi:hypothetical protein
MSTPSEPLLPVEPDRPSRLQFWILVGSAGGVLAGVAAALILTHRSGATPGETAPPDSAERPPLGPPKSGPDRSRPGEAPGGGPEERQAKELYDAAEAFERSEPGEHEKRIARWREVVTRFPTSSWGRKADERHRAAAASLQSFLDRAFESTRRDAQSLAAAGHFLDAIEAIQSYKAAQSRDVLRRRADLEIAGIENAARLAFNEAAAKSKDLAAKGDYAAAVALFESLSRSVIPEVASKCQSAIAQLRSADAEKARHLQSRKGEDARRAFRDEVAPKILGYVRARQYDLALKELSAAAGSAANAALREEIAAERASVADASSFWDAFLKTLRGKTGQEATILLADGRRVSGKISRIQTDRIVLDAGDGLAEAPLDKLHADMLVGWTVGRSLPAEEAVTYVKAALFFFCEGRDDLAKLYLATARELSGPADAAEKVFREGFLRAAMSLRK